jgi:NADPH-dependent glutamate synthase beta subunit-like oxidoreductase
VNAKPPLPTAWTTGSTEVFKTGTWRAALPEHIHAPSPCHAACPVEGDIAEWIGRARERDFRGAFETLARHNPFPAIAGRVCHHPCEAACNRAGLDGSLAICRLERYVGDVALEQRWALPPAEAARSERVAVVGGGPSGLSAAYQLCRRGYRVTLLEATAELGGVMRHGIPPYRLPRSVLDGEIERIVALGVEVRCGEALATAEDFERLRTRFDAVYLAVGAGCQKRLPRLDYRKPWVMDGAEYLARANAGSPPPLGKRLAVIGGGSAAIDVARSARRAGHEVTLLALETRAQLPAQPDEVTEAIEEGIALVDGTMLTDAGDPHSGTVRLRCIREPFEPGARRGQFTVVPIAGTEFAFEADAIVLAIGQDPDLAPLHALDTNGTLLHVDAAQTTSLEHVYAGGDVASMARFVTEAIGMGKRAAFAIDRALSGREPPEREAEPIVSLAAINTFYHSPRVRATERRLPAAERIASGAEVQQGFTSDEALGEASRCFSCGTCIACDNCVHFCPDLAVRHDPDGYVVLADYCKGCGLCVRECPTGSMKMAEESK